MCAPAAQTSSPCRHRCTSLRSQLAKIRLDPDHGRNKGHKGGHLADRLLDHSSRPQRALPLVSVAVLQAHRVLLQARKVQDPVPSIPSPALPFLSCLLPLLSSSHSSLLLPCLASFNHGLPPLFPLPLSSSLALFTWQPRRQPEHAASLCTQIDAPARATWSQAARHPLNQNNEGLMSIIVPTQVAASNTLCRSGGNRETNKLTGTTVA